MNIMPVNQTKNNVSFSSKLPIGTNAPKAEFKDAWTRLRMACRELNQTERLNNLLNKLNNNGDNNILAFDYGPKKFNSKVYTFGLFKDEQDLESHRQVPAYFFNLLSKTITKNHITIAPCYPNNFADTDPAIIKGIGNEAMTLCNKKIDSNANLLDHILNTLEKIITKGTEENISIFGYDFKGK